jgi:hypothetical protein
MLSIPLPKSSGQRASLPCWASDRTPATSRLRIGDALKHSRIARSVGFSSGMASVVEPSPPVVPLGEVEN